MPNYSKPKQVEGFRERRAGNFTSISQISTWSDNGPVTSETYYPAERIGTVKSMVDWVTPGYKKLSVQGLIINKECWRTSVKRTVDGNGPAFRRVYKPAPDRPVQVYTGDLSGEGWTAGGLPLSSFPSATELPAYDYMYGLVQTRCYANIDKPDYQSQIFLGEFRETVRYLRNPFESGLKLAATLNGKLRKAGIFDKSVDLSKGKIREDISSAYLAIVYGFQPLVKDVVGILENLRPRAVDRPKRETARAKNELITTRSWTTRESYAGAFSYDAAYSYKRVVTVKCGMLYEHAAAQTDYDKWGLRPKDIPLTVWQLTSLSFVVDWFANIGEFVSAITPSAGTKTLSMWTTTIIEETLTRKASNHFMAVDGWVRTRDGYDVETLTRTTYHRSPNTFAPVLAFKDLAFLRNDVSKLTSLAALLSSRVKNLESYDPKIAYRFVNTKKWRGTGD